MPRAEVKAEMHWQVWPLKPGKFCSGCKNKLGDSAVMVTVVFVGFDPMPAKKYCQACFDSKYRFWERNGLFVEPKHSVPALSIPPYEPGWTVEDSIQAIQRENAQKGEQ